MLTRKRFSAPNLTGDDQKDLAALGKAFQDYLLSIEAPDSLTLTKAHVDTTPVGALDPSTGAFTTLSIAAGAVIAGGYTPTLTNAVNVAASTTNPFNYLRVGDRVTVSGLIAIDPTAASTPTTLRISLPISSTFTGTTDGAGVGSSTIFGLCGAINASIGNNAMGLNFTSDAGAANQTWAVHFTYQIK